MDKAQAALEKYAKAVLSIKDYGDQNKSVFEEHNRLMMNVIDAESELRDIVAVEKKGFDNGMFKVVVTPMTQTVFDEERIREEMPEAITVVERPLKISISEIDHGGAKE